MYAVATGESSTPSTKYTFCSTFDSGTATAAPAGLTCLNEAAAGSPVAFLSSRTSCQLFIASSRLIYPGRPFKTWNGSSPSSMNTFAGFWFGLQPYFSSSSFILLSPLQNHTKKEPTKSKAPAQTVGSHAATLHLHSPW